MKLLRFTFKNEAVFTVTFSLALPIIGGLILLLLAWLIR